MTARRSLQAMAVSTLDHGSPVRGRARTRLGAALLLGGLLLLLLAASPAGAAHFAAGPSAQRAAALAVQTQLVAPDGAAGDQAGWSVALDGDTALVGAPNADVSGNAGQGSVYVFVRSAGSWVMQAHITAADGAAGDGFGRSVALSGDTALIGANEDDVGGNVNQGSAFVFVRSVATWSQQGQLVAPDGGAWHGFGPSVALNGDTALVGDPFDTAGTSIGVGSQTTVTSTRGLEREKRASTSGRYLPSMM